MFSAGTLQNQEKSSTQPVSQPVSAPPASLDQVMKNISELNHLVTENEREVEYDVGGRGARWVSFEFGATSVYSIRWLETWFLGWGASEFSHETISEYYWSVEFKSYCRMCLM